MIFNQVSLQTGTAMYTWLDQPSIVIFSQVSLQTGIAMYTWLDQPNIVIFSQVSLQTGIAMYRQKESEGGCDRLRERGGVEPTEREGGRYWEKGEG